MTPALLLAVVVLSKHRPEQLAIEGCGAVKSLRATADGVEACADRCRTEAQVILQCPGGARVRALGLSPRTYGKTLRASIEDHRLRVVSDIELEDYVAGVVASEMAGAPEEARKALAVVVRTYALAAKEHPRHADADLCDLTHCQVLASIAKDRLAEGRTLGRGPVFFHSTCGGHTRSAHDVWPELTDVDQIGVSDLDPNGRPYCEKSPHSTWIYELGEEELARALSDPASRKLHAPSLELEAHDDRFKIRDRDGSSTVSSYRLHLELGRRLGWSAVKSPSFTAERAGKRFRLRGRGLGHGVGLCQYGAIERAKRGASAEEILRAYFPKRELSP